MIYVFAGSFAEAQRWARSAGVGLFGWTYLTADRCAETLRGVGPPSRLVSVGPLPAWARLSRDCNLAIDLTGIPLEQVDPI